MSVGDEAAGDRIRRSDDTGVRVSSERPGVTPDRLRDVVAKVGDRTADVEQELAVSIANYR
jgi:hypothetical protein